MIGRIALDVLDEGPRCGWRVAFVRAVLRRAAPRAFYALSLDHSPSRAVFGQCRCRDCREARR